MSSRVIAVCDLCGKEQEFKISAPVDATAWGNELRMEGWQELAGTREACQDHPRLVTT